MAKHKHQMPGSGSEDPPPEEPQAAPAEDTSEPQASSSEAEQYTLTTGPGQNPDTTHHPGPPQKVSTVVTRADYHLWCKQNSQAVPT